MTPQERAAAAQLAECVRAFRVQGIVDVFSAGFSADVDDPLTGKPVLFTLMDIVAAMDEDDERLGTACALVFNLNAVGKANPNICDRDGVSALRHALKLENDFLVAALVGFKADVNERYADTGDTPLHDAVRQAAKHGGVRTLKNLLNAGANAAIANDKGQCAYDVVLAEAARLAPASSWALYTAQDMMEKTQPVKDMLDARAQQVQQMHTEKLRARVDARLRLKPPRGKM